MAGAVLGAAAVARGDEAHEGTESPGVHRLQLPNHGVLRVGDSLTEGENIRFTGIPNFAPEILRRVRLDDPMRSKQLARGLADLAEEGVMQVFRPMIGSGWIVGVVGQLQLEVLTARMATEYKVKMSVEPMNAESARWIAAPDATMLKRFVDANRGSLVEDSEKNPVLLVRGNWELRHLAEKWPDISFPTTRERA